MSRPTKAAEIIREALNLLYHAAYEQGHHDTVEGCYTHVLSIDRHTYHDEAVQDLLRDEELRALALLADMEREGESVRYGTAPGLQRNCSGCDFLSTPSESKHFRYCPGCGSVIEHPSPTTADAKDSTVDMQEVIRAGEFLKEKLSQLRIRQYQMMSQWAEASEEKKAELWSRLHERTDQYLDAIEQWSNATKPFRP